MGAFHKTSVRCSQRLLILIWLAVLAGASARAAVVNATFNTAADIGIPNRTGLAPNLSTLNVVLNFAPQTGTTLTVMKGTVANVGSTGVFSNVAHGQIVVVDFNGVTYNFVASYFGGSGFDMVLQWRGTRLMSWGDDSRGELGNNVMTTTPVPVVVPATGALAGKTVVELAAGNSFSVARCSDGSLLAWGANDSGQLGNGTTVDSTVPVPVNTVGALAGKAVQKIVAGRKACLALCADGSLVSWGSNAQGQLGNNSTIDSSVPVAVPTGGTALSGKVITAIASGLYHCLALCSDGSVVAWGQNFSGQLGDNSNSQRTTAVQVVTAGTALSGQTVVGLAAGDSHSLAVCANGTVAAWGANSFGQLGNNSTTDSSVAVHVSNSAAPLIGKTVVSVSGASYSSLALCSDGTVAAWGHNGYGELGNGSITDSRVPVAVSRLNNGLTGRTVIAISSGVNDCQALCSDGTVAMWGYNAHGELGVGSFASFGTPSTTKTTGTALAGRSFTATASGLDHCLGLCSDGTLAAWGANYRGQLGTGAPPAYSTPADVASSTVLSGKTIVGISTGFSHSLAWCSDGTIAAWGYNDYFQFGLQAPLISTVPIASHASADNTFIAISSGTRHNVALSTKLEVYTWGNGSSGQLGNGGFTQSVSPSFVYLRGLGGGTYPMAVAAGSFHSLVLMDNGKVGSWGLNSSGQLGTNSTTDSAVPRAVTTTGTPLSGKTVKAIAAGSRHSLALCTDGTVVGWGYNFIGQLGNASSVDSKIPVAVDTSGALAGKTVVSIGAGGWHSLALCSDGTLVAWGQNYLGNGTNVSSNVPVVISSSGALAGKQVRSFIVGGSFVVAQLDDGSFASWGNNDKGQLGLGSTVAFADVPTAFPFTGLTSGEKLISMLSSSDSSLAVIATPSSPIRLNTLPVSQLTLTGATLNGLVNAYGGSEAVTFDYGLTESYGASITSVPSVVNGSADTNVSAVLTGLPQSTTYHYRIKTASLVGSDATFTTLSNDADLANLSDYANFSPSPAFDRAITQYTVASPYSADFIEFVITASNANATVQTQVNGGDFTPVNWVNTHGYAAINVGDNTINVKVTSSDGTTKTYTIIVTRGPPGPDMSTDSSSSLTPRGATVSGTVVSLGTNASVFVEYGTTPALGSIMVASPSTVTGDVHTTVSANLSSLASNTLYYYRISGINNLGTSHGITMVFTTLKNNDATLSNLTISQGAFATAFAPSTTIYNASVPLATTSISLTATLADPHATLVLSSTDAISFLSSGVASSPLSLSATASVEFDLRVIAQDGVATKTYAIIVAHRSSYEAWRFKYFRYATNGYSYTQDYDGDGLNNLTEFAFGTLPADSKSGGSPLSYIGNVISPGSAITEVIANKPTAEYIRRSDYLTSGLTYTVQFSAKLNAWETDTRTPTVLATDGINEVVGLIYPKLSTGAQAKFFRVTASVAP